MIILDGGTGTLIQALGAPMDGDTWCADANLTHPDIVNLFIKPQTPGRFKEARQPRFASDVPTAGE